LDDQPAGNDAPQPPTKAESTKSAQANVLFAKRLIATGDHRKAFKLLEDAVEQAADAESLFLLAQLELTRPQMELRALEHLKRAVDLAPNLTDAWLALANYWGVRGQPDKQRRCLERILSYDPKNRDVRSALEFIIVKR
jgi:Tfp pilus assembly protein PilF